MRVTAEEGNLGRWRRVPRQSIGPAVAVALAAAIKLQPGLALRGALETVAHYLELLQDTHLVAALEKLAKAQSASERPRQSL